MWGLVLAGLAVLFAADSQHTKAKAATKLGPDGKPIKVKTREEELADAKAAGRKEAETERAALDERDKRIRSMVRREMRYRPPAAAGGGGGDE